MLRVLLVASHSGSPTLSYYWDWFEALRDHADFEVDVLDTTAKAMLPLALAARRFRRYDLLLFPYGFYYANQDPWSRAWLQRLADFRGLKVFFLENEYRFLSRKLAFAQLLGADYVTSQLPQDAAVRAYGAFFPAQRIVSLPHGLNARLADTLDPERAARPRPIDLSLSGDPYPFYLGHQDRQQLAQFFTDNAQRFGLKLEVRQSRAERLERGAWLEYLCRCRGALHHESGTDHLDVSDSLRERVNAYVAERPGVSFADVHAAFFEGRAPGLSGRALAPRHLEAIATHTCQIMFPGRYSDVLEPERHYLVLRRDFSNADEVLRRFLDEGERRALTERAYQHVRGAHTLEHRITALKQATGLA